MNNNFDGAVLLWPFGSHRLQDLLFGLSLTAADLTFAMNTLTAEDTISHWGSTFCSTTD